MRNMIRGSLSAKAPIVSPQSLQQEVLSKHTFDRRADSLKEILLESECPATVS
jgi:hypothetical protein